FGDASFVHGQRFGAGGRRLDLSLRGGPPVAGRRFSVYTIHVGSIWFCERPGHTRPPAFPVLLVLALAAGYVVEEVRCPAATSQPARCCARRPWVAAGAGPAR